MDEKVVINKRCVICNNDFNHNAIPVNLDGGRMVLIHDYCEYRAAQMWLQQRDRDQRSAARLCKIVVEKGI